MNREKPDIVIIHIGSNDANEANVKKDNAIEIAQTILRTAIICKETGVNHVFISGILPKHNLKLTKFVRKVNDILKDFCISNSDNINFILNDSITIEFVSDDGVHLIKDGTHILASNFVNCIHDITHH